MRWLFDGNRLTSIWMFLSYVLWGIIGLTFVLALIVEGIR